MNFGVSGCGMAGGTKPKCPKALSVRESTGQDFERGAARPSFSSSSPGNFWNYTQYLFKLPAAEPGVACRADAQTRIAVSYKFKTCASSNPDMGCGFQSTGPPP